MPPTTATSLPKLKCSGLVWRCAVCVRLWVLSTPLLEWHSPWWITLETHGMRDCSKQKQIQQHKVRKKFTWNGKGYVQRNTESRLEVIYWLESWCDRQKKKINLVKYQKWLNSKRRTVTEEEKGTYFFRAMMSMQVWMYEVWSLLDEVQRSVESTATIHVLPAAEEAQKESGARWCISPGNTSKHQSKKLCTELAKDTRCLAMGPVRIRSLHTFLPPSPVILWISLGGKPKWLPLDFGYHDVMRTTPLCVMVKCHLSRKTEIPACILFQS